MLEIPMTDPVIHALNISKSFATKGNDPFSSNSNPVLALDQVSISLFPGETLGIAGESGCGKSTLAKLITGLLTPDSGKILFEGKDISTFNKSDTRNFRRSVQMIFQDPFSSLNPRMRAGDIIAEPLVIHKLAAKKDQHQKTVQLMEQVGLSADHYNRFPHEFSGGQRQRIGIARALAVSPKVLVADEPVSSLDISIQAQIINLLLAVQRNRDLTMAVVSHDLSVLRHISSRIAVMYLGTVVETASADSFFRQCRHPYSETLLAAIPSIKPLSSTARPADKAVPSDISSTTNQQTGCCFHNRCRYAAEICSLTKPVLHETKPGHYSACHFTEQLFI
jgi:peptide/nickel transport system ATP-binding protein